MRAAAVALVLLSGLLAGCGGGQSALEPQSRASREIATLWWWMFVVACVVFAGAVGLLGIAWLRRRRAGLPVVEGERPRLNLALVLVFGIVIPIIVNVALFVIANFVVIKDTEAPAATTTPLTIEVAGRQWFWEVRYPGTEAVTANEVHIPARANVELVAKSSDVVHSFWVPRLNRKIDMIPGQTSSIVIDASKPGVYRGQCAEFCGVQHGNMAFLVIAEPPAHFASWLDKEAEPGHASPVFTRAGCGGCHSITGRATDNRFGPDLTHFGSRRTIAAGTLPNTRDDLAAWLRDPQAIKPGNKMPNLELGDDEIRSLVGFLESNR